jgi:Fe-S-cluster containining protein/ribosomal protein S18 acetylase RimI-like enzyme
MGREMSEKKAKPGRSRGRGEDRFPEPRRLGAQAFRAYHRDFYGDTFDACSRCGGKCEQYKIAALMPGEKLYMAQELGVSLRHFEEAYIDSLDTPYGAVDVLKLKDRCNLLTEDNRCAADKCRPVLCECYPIAFRTKGSTVVFEIDRQDCPMTRWPEYAGCVERFANEGVRALKRLKAPLAWWRIVEIFDEFDFDYVRIERDLRSGHGYEVFLVEEILGYACNGYETAARRRGLHLLHLRIRMALAKALAGLDAIPAERDRFRKSLQVSYRRYLRNAARNMLGAIKDGLRDAGLLGDRRGAAYRLIVAECKELLRKIERDADSFCIRLGQQVPPPAEAIRLTNDWITLTGVPDRAFRLGGGRGMGEEFEVCEVLNFRSRRAEEGYALLSRWFGPDQLDTPLDTARIMDAALRLPSSFTRITNLSGTKDIWFRWIMVMVCSKSGRPVSVGDGAVVASRDASLFYASHIATSSRLRSRGLGTRLTEYMLQVASNHLPEAEAALGKCRWAKSMPALMQEVAEIEFPDPSHLGSPSMQRLPFHGRASRAALWPYRYAQPDTDYHLRRFDPARWNSVPMFFCQRPLREDAAGPRAAIRAGELLLDYFVASAGRAIADGIEMERANIRKGLAVDKRAALIPFPSDGQGLPAFVSRTGYAHEILAGYYPDHKYTRDRGEILGLLRTLWSSQRRSHKAST